MSKLTPKEEAHYTAMSERAEAADYTPIDQLDELATGPRPSVAELDELLSELDPLEATNSPDTPTGAQAKDRATKGDAQELAAMMGRPSLNGTPGGGASPKRQVRLPHDLDAALDARAARDGRQPSAIIRDALTEYLCVS